MNNFKALRKLNNLTQQKTAELMKIPQSMISRIDNMNEEDAYQYYESLYYILNEMYVENEIDDIVFPDGSKMRDEPEYER